jgi:hypothetical protein
MKNQPRQERWLPDEPLTAIGFGSQDIELLMIALYIVENKTKRYLAVSNTKTLPKQTICK